MERKNLFPMGEVSKLFHISVSSLLHYENTSPILALKIRIKQGF